MDNDIGSLSAELEEIEGISAELETIESDLDMENVSERGFLGYGHMDSQTELEEKQIESYLGLKYGITLRNDDTTSLLDGNYYLSDGTTIVWNGTLSGPGTDADFHKNVAGIGTDIESDIYRRIGKSRNEDAMMSFRRASRYQSDVVWHWYNLTEILVDMRRFHDAIQPGGEHLKISPDIIME